MAKSARDLKVPPVFAAMTALPEPAQKHLAKFLVAACIRNNTSLEELHGAGRLDDAEMKRLMIECADNVYTFLKVCSDMEFMTKLVEQCDEIAYWDDPKLSMGRTRAADGGLVQADTSTA